MDRRSKLQCIAVLCLYCFAAAGTWMNSAINAFMQAFPDISQTNILLAATLPNLFGTATMLVIGRLVGSKLKYKTSCLMGCVIILAGGLLPYFINLNWSLILVCRALSGIGAGCFGVRAVLLGMSVPTEKQAQFLGYGTIAQTAGNIVIGPAVGALVEISWRHAFLIYGLAVIPLVLVILFLHEPETKKSDIDVSADKTATIQENAKEKMPWQVWVYAFFTFAGIVGLYPLLSGMSIFVSAHGIGTALIAGTIGSAYTIAGVVSNLLLKPIMKTCKRFTLTIMSVIVIVGQAVVLYVPLLPATFIGTIFCGFGYQAVVTITQTYNLRITPASRRASGSTILLACGQLAVFVSSYFIAACNSIFKMQGSTVDSAFLGCLIVFGIITAMSLIPKISPEDNN